MLEQLESLSATALAELEAVNSSDALREWESKYLGKKGSVIELVRSTGKLPKEERPAFGQRANEIKTLLRDPETKPAEESGLIRPVR